MNSSDLDGSTPLHDAAEFGESDGVKTLVSLGANILAENNDGEIPFWKLDKEKFPEGSEIYNLLSPAVKAKEVLTNNEVYSGYVLHQMKLLSSWLYLTEKSPLRVQIVQMGGGLLHLLLRLILILAGWLIQNQKNYPALMSFQENYGMKKNFYSANLIMLKLLK